MLIFNIELFGFCYQDFCISLCILGITLITCIAGKYFLPLRDITQVVLHTLLQVAIIQYVYFAFLHPWWVLFFSLASNILDQPNKSEALPPCFPLIFSLSDIVSESLSSFDFIFCVLLKSILRLKRWLLDRTQVQFLAPMCQLTTLCNSISRESAHPCLHEYIQAKYISLRKLILSAFVEDSQ